jgi:hypothetical protein
MAQSSCELRNMDGFLELELEHLAEFDDELFTPEIANDKIFTAEEDFGGLDRENTFFDELVDGDLFDELIEDLPDEDLEDISNDIEETYSYQPPTEPLPDR